MCKLSLLYVFFLKVWKRGGYGWYRYSDRWSCHEKLHDLWKQCTFCSLFHDRLQHVDVKYMLMLKKQKMNSMVSTTLLSFNDIKHVRLVSNIFLKEDVSMCLMGTPHHVHFQYMSYWFIANSFSNFYYWSSTMFIFVWFFWMVVLLRYCLAKFFNCFTL